MGRRAVVDDLELEAGVAKRERHRDVGRVGVLERVRERLLHDPVDGELDAAGKRRRLTDHLQSYGQSGGAVARDELVQLGERGLRARLRPLLGLSQQREDSPQLGQALLAASLDAGERLVGDLGRGAQHVAGTAHADQHDADRVGDDVVQLTGDRRPLLVDRDPGQLLALALGGGRALLELAPVAPLRLGVGAERPDADREQRRR